MSHVLLCVVVSHYMVLMEVPACSYRYIKVANGNISRLVFVTAGPEEGVCCDRATT